VVKVLGSAIYYRIWSTIKLNHVSLFQADPRIRCFLLDMAQEKSDPKAKPAATTAAEKSGKENTARGHLAPGSPEQKKKKRKAETPPDVKEQEQENGKPVPVWVATWVSWFKVCESHRILKVSHLKEEAEQAVINFVAKRMMERYEEDDIEGVTEEEKQGRAKLPTTYEEACDIINNSNDGESCYISVDKSEMILPPLLNSACVK
jgi:hypothetical protein